MLNIFSYLFDMLLDEKNEVETGTGLMFGYYFSANFIFPLEGLAFISWEAIISSFGGIIVAVVTALALNLGKDFYEFKIKNKIFKNDKEKGNKKRA